MGRTVREVNRISGDVIRIAARVILWALIVLAAVRGSAAAYSFGHSVFYESAVDQPPGRDVSVTFARGTDMAEAASLLKQKGLVRGEWQVRIQAAFLSLKVKPGTYTLNTSQTSREILEVLNSGTDETEAQKESGS